MGRCRAVVARLEEVLLVAGLGVLVVLVFFQVVMRYVFGGAFCWCEEVARFLFLWMVWIGAGFAAKQRAHLRIGAFVERLTGRPRRTVEALALAVWIGFSAFLAFKGAELTVILLRRGQLSPILQIPMGYAYGAVPVGTGLMLFRLLEQAWEGLRGVERGSVS